MDTSPELPFSGRADSGTRIQAWVSRALKRYMRQSNKIRHFFKKFFSLICNSLTCTLTICDPPFSFLFWTAQTLGIASNIGKDSFHSLQAFLHIDLWKEMKEILLLRIYLFNKLNNFFLTLIQQSYAELTCTCPYYWNLFGGANDRNIVHTKRSNCLMNYNLVI